MTVTLTVVTLTVLDGQMPIGCPIRKQSNGSQIDDGPVCISFQQVSNGANLHKARLSNELTFTLCAPIVSASCEKIPGIHLHLGRTRVGYRLSGSGVKSKAWS